MSLRVDGVMPAAAISLMSCALGKSPIHWPFGLEQNDESVIFIELGATGRREMRTR
jgi:hypothetical protein